MPVDYTALLAMPAGPELDAAIARLAGYDVSPAVAAIYFGEDNDTVMTFYANGQWYAQPAYSTDLNAAMQLTIPGYAVMVCGNEAAAGKRYASAFEDDTSQEGDNPAHAVCRVWLWAAKWGYFVPPGLAKESDR